MRSSEKLDRFDRRQNADVEPRGVLILQVLLDLGDDLGVVRALGVEPEHRRGAGEARAAHPELDPVLDRRVLELAHAEDVAGLDRTLQQHLAVIGDDANRSVRGNFERLVVRAVLFGRLRHQAHVGNRAHGLGIERTMGLTVVDDRLIHPRVAAVRDRGYGVVQLAVGAPHAAGFADHRRNRSVDDDVAGHVQAGDPFVGIDHGEARPFRVLGLDVGLDRFFFGCRQRLDLRQQLAEAVVQIDAETLQRSGVLLDHIGEEDGNGMAEDDGIGDLHHGRLHVQREQHAFLFAASICSAKKVRSALRLITAASMISPA